MEDWGKIIEEEKELITWILKTESEVKLREFAWSNFRKTAKVVNDDIEAPFIIWPAINREPYQVWLPVLLMQVVRLRIRSWLGEGDEIVVFGVPSSGKWYGEVWQQVKVLEKDGWQVSYPEVEKVKNLKVVPQNGWKVRVPSYVHARLEDGSRGEEEMVIREPDLFKGRVVVALDDAIAEGLTLSYLSRSLKQELGAKRVVVGGAMAKEMQGGRERLLKNQMIDKVISLVEVTKEVLNDLNR